MKLQEFAEEVRAQLTAGQIELAEVGDAPRSGFTKAANGDKFKTRAKVQKGEFQILVGDNGKLYSRVGQKLVEV